MVKYCSPLLCAVIGESVSNSLSPLIFEFISNRMKMSVIYKSIDITSKNLARSTKSLTAQGYVGWNVTIPYKQQILKYIDILSDEANIVRAVNVIEYKEGKLIGHNTDVYGIQKAFEEKKVRINSRSCVIFGAGGAAYAATYTLAKNGAAKIWILNRTKKKAQTLCKIFSKYFPETKFYSVYKLEKSIELPTIFINATPHDCSKVQFEKFKLKYTHSNVVCFDMVYRPLNTTFLLKAKGNGFKTIDGLDMLIWQALATWEIWFAKLPQKAILKKQIKADLIKQTSIKTYL